MADTLTHDMDCELIIGLVAAVGAELGPVSKLLSEQLALAGYRTDEIRISKDVIPLMVDVANSFTSKYEEYSKLMTAGNDARELAAAGDKFSKDGNAALAYGAAAKILTCREKDADGKVLPAEKRAFIIRSLKRPEEVEALRMIYPQGFILIGYTPKRSGD